MVEMDQTAEGASALSEEIRSIDRDIMDLIHKRTCLAERIGRMGDMPEKDTETEVDVTGTHPESSGYINIDAGILEQIAKAFIGEAMDQEHTVPSDTYSKKVSIVGGAGMMGRWMERFLSKRGCEVRIIDPASGNGLTLENTSESDIVVVSVPIYAADGILKELDSICRNDALIFDLTSLKTPISKTLTGMAGRRKVCSIHPMFGPSAESVRGRNLIVCDCGSGEAVDEAVSVFGGMGGNIRVMPIEKHDEYMSYVLGLSHAVNIAFFTVLERSGIAYEDMRTVASTTFMKNMETNMSVASEDPRLYYDIQHLNDFRDVMWEMFSDAVDDIKKASRDEDPTEFIKIMNAGREYFT
ncbi:MAG: prephenate dehydrogenase/arogenate dehydrogenase family protein [Candidatus Methanoplasma sp.]|jgi:chorismate mutase/prephenate dehydrogenase|nr:prephenate dehydrogenase/arogenate dehydrogenase family protein [Candidatus Methanoplasma sp.]